MSRSPEFKVSCAMVRMLGFPLKCKGNHWMSQAESDKTWHICHNVTLTTLWKQTGKAVRNSSQGVAVGVLVRNGGHGTMTQWGWDKVQQLQGRLGTRETLSVQLCTFSFPYKLTISSLLMACGNYSYVESQFSKDCWIQFYLSLIVTSWPLCQVYFRSRRKEPVRSHKHGWVGLSLLGPSSLLFPSTPPSWKALHSHSWKR